MSEKSNFAKYIENFTAEPVEFVVIGRMGGKNWANEDWSNDYSSELVPNYKYIPKFQVLTWEDGRKWLDFETGYDYGAPEQPAIYAYTKSFVIAVSQYDGSTSLFAIPRNPIICKPEMPGR